MIPAARVVRKTTKLMSGEECRCANAPLLDLPQGAVKFYFTGKMKKLEESKEESDVRKRITVNMAALLARLT